MPFRLKPPVEETFFLDKTDAEFPPDPDAAEEYQKTYVVIRQATQAQHERRSDLFSKLTSRVGNDPNVVEIVSHFSYPELMRLEVYLTLKDSNLEDENGNKLFRPGMGEREFNQAWGKLPPLVAREIHEKVLIVNPDWGQRGEALSTGF